MLFVFQYGHTITLSQGGGYIGFLIDTKITFLSNDSVVTEILKMVFTWGPSTPKIKTLYIIRQYPKIILVQLFFSFPHMVLWVRVRVMVFNATFNNI